MPNVEQGRSVMEELFGSRSHNSNMEVFQKINSILDNTLDLSAITGITGKNGKVADNTAVRLSDLLGNSPSSPLQHDLSGQNFFPNDASFLSQYGVSKGTDLSSPIGNQLNNEFSFCYPSSNPTSPTTPSSTLSGLRGYRGSLSDCMGSPTVEEAIMMGCQNSPQTKSTLRSTSPTESNTSSTSSGISSVVDLAELMNALSLPSSNVAPTPTPPPSPAPTSPLLSDLSWLTQLSQPPPSPTPTLPTTIQELLSHPAVTGLDANHNQLPMEGQDPVSLEKAARLYRNATALYDANCTWSGQLPPRFHTNPIYSCKVFLGGVPWDVTDATLIATFKQFGNIKVEWPERDSSGSPRGYVYILFEEESEVKALLKACNSDFMNGGNWFYRVPSRRIRVKEVQVIPWVIADSNCVRGPTQRLDPQKTVFVGALHGMITSEALAQIMNDLFGKVVYAGIDTDKHKYPIGSGRVTFSSYRSYTRAVAAAFVEIKTPKFTKKVQIDPYLEDSTCSLCGVKQGPYFCRDLTCFRYYCRTCWQWQHGNETFNHHRPLMRNSRNNHYGGNTVASKS